MLLWNTTYHRFNSRPMPKKVSYPPLLVLAAIYRCSRPDAQRRAYKEAMA